MASFLCPTAPALAQTPLVGVYDGGQMEVAAGLRLKADGRFDYFLAYGALDEHANGRWTTRDGHVQLTTVPRPRLPRFTLLSDTVSPDGKLYVALDRPGMLDGFSLTVRLFYASANKPIFVEAAEDGSVPVPPGAAPIAVVPDLPIYEAPLEPYPLKPGGHHLVFRFEPNDLGVADFRDEPLAIDQSELVLRRFDLVLHFRKESE